MWSGGVAARESGAMWSWGRAEKGQLGHGDEENQLRPKHIVALTERVVAVSAGSYHSLAVTASGTLFSCGSGMFGKLGHGDTETRLPKRVAIF